MKKLISLLVILAVLLMVDAFTVKADIKGNPKYDDDIVGICTYGKDVKPAGGEKYFRKISVYINKDYTLELYLNDTYTHIPIKDGLVYSDFVNSEGNLYCRSEIYYDEYADEAKEEYYVSTVAFSSYKNKVFNGKYSYVSEDSTIKNESFEKQEYDNSNWYYICHYGSKYLKFNSVNYETNALVGGNFTAYKDYTDCPMYMCSETYDNFSYDYFTNSNGYNCTPAVVFAGEYRCGPLRYYTKEYEQALDSKDQDEIKEAKESIQSFCSSAYKSMNYADSNNCVKECMTIENDIWPEIKTTECGFSDKLVAWIENILRWVKYIVPVILIVLSILDFIKAIASEKEDEMKKAQKHFTTRLIAAVLIFLMPILIEFILDKMGFSAEDCGISNIGF